MNFVQQRNDLAPLSDFVVTETIHVSRARRKVNLYEWGAYLTTPLSVDWDRLVIIMYAHEPHDIEVVLTDDMIANGWKVEWSPV